MGDPALCNICDNVCDPTKASGLCFYCDLRAERDALATCVKELEAKLATLGAAHTWEDALNAEQEAHRATQLNLTQADLTVSETECERAEAVERAEVAEARASRLAAALEETKEHVTAIYAHYSEEEIARASASSQLGHYQQAMSALRAALADSAAEAPTLRALIEKAEANLDETERALKGTKPREAKR
jgi:chromosome segregation ATPase